MENFICRNPQCDRKGQHCSRGLCYACYMSKRQAVTKGTDTWESNKFRQPGCLGRPKKHHVYCELCHSIMPAGIEIYEYQEKLYCMKCFKPDTNSQAVKRSLT